jgi:hypothetical protein
MTGFANRLQPKVSKLLCKIKQLSKEEVEIDLLVIN